MKIITKKTITLTESELNMLANVGNFFDKIATELVIDNLTNSNGDSVSADEFANAASFINAILNLVETEE